VHRTADLPRTPESVSPGLHDPQAGTHEVVWWDPAALELDVTESVGLVQQKLLTADEGGVRSDRGIQEHKQWREARARTRRDAGMRSVVVATATELAKEMELVVAGRTSSTDARAPEGAVSPAPVPAVAGAGAEALVHEIARYETDVLIEDASAADAGRGASARRARARKDAGTADLAKKSDTIRPADALAAARERGQRFGTLVHAILAAVDLEADVDAVRRSAALYARLLGAGEGAIPEAARAVSAALAHPLLRRAAQAARAGECRREVAITATLPDGRLLEGVADAAFYDDGTWTVLDFKTDSDLEAGIDAYRRQVALYAWAIARATGKPARGILLKV
jgi:ATP-dependent exoDNAse (exonuclease V) beta subunit